MIWIIATLSRAVPSTIDEEAIIATLDAQVGTRWFAFSGHDRSSLLGRVQGPGAFKQKIPCAGFFGQSLKIGEPDWFCRVGGAHSPSGSHPCRPQECGDRQACACSRPPHRCDVVEGGGAPSLMTGLVASEVSSAARNDERVPNPSVCTHGERGRRCFSFVDSVARSSSV